MLNRESPAFFRAVSAGFAGGAAWIVGMMLLFGPAQIILADPAYQGRKFLFVMGQLEPLPYTAGAWWILPIGLLAIGVLYGVVYHFVRMAFVGKPWWSKGLRFGSVAWTLMVPWFEFYLPWNVMHEPAELICLEMVLWFGVMVIVGLAIAGVYEWRSVEESAKRSTSGVNNLEQHHWRKTPSTFNNEVRETACTHFGDVGGVFACIYVGAIPFSMLSVAWIVRDVGRKCSTLLPALSASFFFISAYLYLLAAGRGIPVWVYSVIVFISAGGAVSTVKKIRKQSSSKHFDSHT